MSDIPLWLALSREYDQYVFALVPDLKEWYEGGEGSVAFDAYVRSKIAKSEAYIAQEGANIGIIAFSRQNNRITFFGISHSCEYEKTAAALLKETMEQLDKFKSITVHALKGDAPQIQREYAFFTANGFEYIGDALENGVPVSVLQRPPDAPS